MLYGKSRRGAGISPRRFFQFMLMCTVCIMSAGHAAPFIPKSDDLVLERLPDAGDRAAQALRAKHRALAADPRNLPLALDVARGDLDRARALGDPRFLGRAEAALAPWPQADSAPPDVMLLRAIILQSNHDFSGALFDLAQVLRDRPKDAQAWITRAAIYQAQADYGAASASCGQFANLLLGLAPDICTASVVSLTGHAPLALRATALSLKVNASEAAREPGVAVWAMTLAAETATRLGDPSAEGWFTRAMAIAPDDPYLLGAWSDWLLDHQRPRDVISLLGQRTRIDPLLLRLSLAETATGSAMAAQHVVELGDRFEASRLRGDTVHRREEARYQLALRQQPARALALARANWDVQREPADARILLECAIAARNPESAAPVLSWMQTNSVEDMALTALARRLRTISPGS